MASRKRRSTILRVDYSIADILKEIQREHFRRYGVRISLTKASEILANQIKAMKRIKTNI